MTDKPIRYFVKIKEDYRYRRINYWKFENNKLYFWSNIKKKLEPSRLDGLEWLKQSHHVREISPQEFCLWLANQ